MFFGGHGVDYGLFLKDFGAIYYLLIFQNGHFVWFA